MTQATFNTAVEAFTNVVNDFGKAYQIYMANKPRPRRQTVG